MKKQENVTHNKENIQLRETAPGMIMMIKLVDKKYKQLL